MSDSVRVYRYICEISNFMSHGWNSLFFFSRGRGFVHSDCPGGGRVFVPFKSCPAGGMVLDEIDTCISLKFKLP